MRERDSLAEVAFDRTILVLFLIRLVLVAIALAALPIRTALPDWLLARYAHLAYPLILLNGAALLLHRQVGAVLQRYRAALAIDLLIALALLLFGGGWRSSYFGYTLTTIVLFAVVDGRRGAGVSAVVLAAASLVKDPTVGVLSAGRFFTESWDMRLGACEFYLVAGVTVGYFKTLQDRLVALSAARLEETRKLASAEEKARVGLELHDGAKQAIIAMLLRMNPLVKRLQSQHDETARELRWLWVGMNFLKSEFDQVMDALKGDNEKPVAANDLVALIEDEVKVAETMTGVSWRVSVDPPGPCLFVGPKEAFRRFVGEALMNAWKHSGQSTGNIAVIRSGGSIVVTISDTGKGFVLDDALAARTTGLASLEHRAAELGGRFAVETAPGRGCQVTLHLPGHGSPLGGCRE